MIHPVLSSPVRSPLADILNFIGWLSGNGGLPSLSSGEYFLTDESGAYLTDENGNYLIGKDT